MQAINFIPKENIFLLIKNLLSIFKYYFFQLKISIIYKLVRKLFD
jgi:hypothetical protein